MVRNPASRKGIGGWKRGARAGNYTAMQWNVACRVRNGIDESSGCSFGDQARISLGILPRGACAVRYGKSVCYGVSGPA